MESCHQQESLLEIITIFKETKMSNYIPPEVQAMHDVAHAKIAETELKRKAVNAVIFIVNFPLLVAVLTGLNKIGFVTITPPSGASDIQSVLALAAVIALIFMVIRNIAGYLYGFTILITCCTSILLLPVFNILVGYASLWAVSYVIPSMFQLSGNLLWGILAGLAIGVGQVPMLGKYDHPALKSPAEQLKKKQ